MQRVKKAPWDVEETKVPAKNRAAQNQQRFERMQVERITTPRPNQSMSKLDVKEMMKKEMFESENGAYDNHFEKSRPSPEGIKGVSDTFVMFDSFEKTESSDLSRGTFAFNMMVQGVTRD